MSQGIARARADLEAGRAWKARDRLAGLLTLRQDDEVLDLLAATYFDLGDLPKAGALWHVTGRDDADAHRARTAWHERYGDERARRASIPAVVRRARMGDRSSSYGRRPRAHAKQTQSWWEPIVFGGGCLLAALLLLVCLVVGFVTSVRWVFG